MKIKISNDFSKAPGPRYEVEGKHSGEEFRKHILYPKVLDALRTHEKLTVDLDGTFGFGTSFLEEAFGGLIRENNLALSDLSALITFVSTEEPDLIEEITAYMKQAEAEKKVTP
jgi:hypothetical protein